MRYLDLCDDVNTVFVTKNLETIEPTSPVSTTSVARFPKLMGVENDQQYNDANIALDKIRTQSSVNGVVIKNFFKDFDKNNCGSIPQDEFLRCVNLLDSSITTAQGYALAKAYGSVHPNNVVMISYRRLHEDVTDTKEVASAMSRLTRDGLAYNKMENPEASHWFQTSETSALEDQLSTYLAQYRIGRSTASGYFLPEDNLRSGCVSMSCFQRGCRRLFDCVAFTHNMLKALCDAYAAPGNKVNYRDFLETLFQKLGHENFQMSGGGVVSPTESSRDPGTRSIIGSQLSSKTHSMTSRSPIAHSRRARTAANTINAAQAFRDGIDGQLSPNNSHAGVQTGMLGGVISDALVEMSPQESGDVTRLLDRIKQVLKARRLDLAWKLQDFDVKGSSTSSRHDHVSATQFVRALVELDLLSVPPDREALLLVKKYAPCDGRHEPLRYVNYRHFLQDVDASYAKGLHGGTIREDGESEITLGRQSRLDPLKDQLELLRIRPGTDIGGPDRTPSSVVASIAKHCKTLNIRLTEFLKDGDPLRHGIINRHKFRTGLAAAKIRISDHEFNHLANRFDAGHKAKDSAGDPFVAWKRFVAEVDAINMKNDEAIEGDDIQFIFATSTPMSPQVDVQDEELIAISLAEIANACVVRRLDLRQSFQDFDKQNRGYVSSAVFDRVLALIGVRPSNPNKMRGLISKFAEQTPDSRVDVNYKAFASAIANIMRGIEEPREVLNTSQYRLNTATGKAARGNMSEYDNRTYVGPEKPVIALKNGAVERVLVDLLAQLKNKNGRLLDFFKDGDRLGGGELSHFKFRSALGRAGLLVDNEMFAELASEFGSLKRRGEMIDWRRFHEALNNTRADLASTDMARQSQQSQGGIGSITNNNNNNNNFEASFYTPKTSPLTSVVGSLGDFGLVDEMESLLDAIAQVTTTKRLLMKPFFQDLDKCNANQVTKAQMGSVLSQNVGLNLSKKEMDLLFEAFCVFDVKGKPTDRFDYKKFIKRVDSVEIH
eukprot:CAMPEP_0114341890 /NCGR_PEP_ID=MMETSP0101-20121206/9371_1 /TAXON_ID=38822 ORGANISM="Pteridomonas danica, Strain PT" /NCGR_SAMPLE_ID=MMETSP0101 /ASSEMBLY_ACC=CAM_ASM_000211 /LENGTH=1000 /DNA_ID=CAMNT_0001475689 /DNA_START=165 /DNA_END=3167 /DNA_ORIENTATION=+